MYRYGGKPHLLSVFSLVNKPPPPNRQTQDATNRRPPKQGSGRRNRVKGRMAFNP